VGAYSRRLGVLLLGCALSIAIRGTEAIHPLENPDQPVPTRAICGESMPARGEQPPTSGQPPKDLPGPFRGTFVAKLENAPYPYTGKYADSDLDFFDHLSPANGERFHTNRYGLRLAEKTHYHDNSVLFHVPTHFDPRKPLMYVVFFHGIQTDVAQSNRDYALAKQVEDSGQNAILIIPQLAKHGADSSPGKFFQRNTFKAFMTEVAEVLTLKLEESYRGGLDEAPILIAAFSGGYKSAAYVLDRGGLDERILGVLLMDALYEDVEKFHHWIRANADRGLFVNIYGQGECEDNSRALARRLNRLELLDHPNWPDEITKGEVIFIQSPHEHLEIPILGPPPEPLRTVLRSIHHDWPSARGIPEDGRGQ
jgi:hypothetical protein